VSWLVLEGLLAVFDHRLQTLEGVRNDHFKTLFDGFLDLALVLLVHLATAFALLARLASLVHLLPVTLEAHLNRVLLSLQLFQLLRHVHALPQACLSVVHQLGVLFHQV